MCATHIPPDMLLNETDRIIVEHKLWGCKYKGKFGIISDFYWTQIGGANNLEFIEKYGDLLNVVHFKNLLPQGNEPKMAPVGEGNINYEKIYKTLKAKGTTEAVAVEQDDCCGDDPFSCLKRSYNNIKTFL